jgi:uncharacterized protein YjeT (DUF2065 family)
MPSFTLTLLMALALVFVIEGLMYALASSGLWQ